MRGGTPSRSLTSRSTNPKNVVNNDETPSADAASIMFWHAGKMLEPRPPGTRRVDRSVPSARSSYSPCMRIPRSGFQNANTSAATTSMFSIALCPVTGRPDASTSCSGDCARCVSMVANASASVFFRWRLRSTSVTTTNSHGWVLPDEQARVAASRMRSSTSGGIGSGR